jgi:glyoxylase-like metal-dependent hydrolase (beta-lactamase superfamily II)
VRHPGWHAPGADGDELIHSSSELAHGIRTMSLPTPWPVGPVNVYLVEDEPLTLIDTGPHWPPSLRALQDSLEQLGYELADIERIVVTHQHLDHAGQASELVQRSGAELCALDGLVDWLESYPESLAAEDRLADRVLRRHGASEEVLSAVWEQNVAARKFGTPASVTLPIADGELLQFANRALRVVHCPGHSPSDTVFHDEQRGVLLAGDVLLAHVRSSAIIAPPLDGSEVHVRPRAFASYVESLHRLEAMELELVLPGHGEPLRDHRTLIAGRLARYEATTERIGALLSSEPQTASELALAFRGTIADGTYFFVLCEILGHLDRLVDRGAAIEIDADGLKRFMRAEG